MNDSAAPALQPAFGFVALVQGHSRERRVTTHPVPEFLLRQWAEPPALQFGVTPRCFGQNFVGILGRGRRRQTAQEFVGELQTVVVRKAENGRFNFLRRIHVSAKTIRRLHRNKRGVWEKNGRCEDRIEGRRTVSFRAWASGPGKYSNRISRAVGPADGAGFQPLSSYAIQPGPLAQALNDPRRWRFGSAEMKRKNFEACDSVVPAAGIEYYYYDQLGLAYSDQPDDETRWEIARFVDEVEQVRKALRLDRSNFYLLGQSWGGILALEYAFAAGGVRRMRVTARKE